jgi:hypothetical protein
MYETRFKGHVKWGRHMSPAFISITFIIGNPWLQKLYVKITVVWDIWAQFGMSLSKFRRKVLPLFSFQLRRLI